MSSPSRSPTSPRPPPHSPSEAADPSNSQAEGSTSTSTRPTRTTRQRGGARASAGGRAKMKEVSSDEDDDEPEYQPPKPAAKRGARATAGRKNAGGAGGRKSTAKEEGAPVLELTNKYKDKFMDLKSRFEEVTKTKTARTQALQVALDRLNKVQLENDAYLQTLALSLPSRPSLAYALDRSKTPTPPPPQHEGLPPMMDGWGQHDPEALAGLVASAQAAAAAGGVGGVEGDAGLLLGLQAFDMQHAAGGGVGDHQHPYYGGNGDGTTHDEMLAHQQLMQGLGHHGGYGMEALSEAVDGGGGGEEGLDDERSSKRVKLE